MDIETMYWDWDWTIEHAEFYTSTKITYLFQAVGGTNCCAAMAIQGSYHSSNCPILQLTCALLWLNLGALAVKHTMEC